MGLKRIVAAVDGAEGDAETLAAAAHLAAKHQAVVTVVPVYPDISTDFVAAGIGMGGFISPEVVGLLQDAETEFRDGVQAGCRAAASDAGIAFGDADAAPGLVLVARETRRGPAMALELVLADLMVISRPSVGAGPHFRDILGDALLHSRCPVLVARGNLDSIAGCAAVAWDGSPQAGRAVKAALPLLARSERVVLLQSQKGLAADQKDGADFERLVRYLALHGIKDVEHTVVEDGREGIALIAEAERQNAGLFVAGAYGHSRLQQTIFGGATHAFLDADTGPLLHLLLAH